MKGSGVCEWCGGPAFNARWGTPQRFCWSKKVPGGKNCGQLAAKARAPERYRAVSARGERRRDLRRKYGISVKEYDAMFEQQGGVCAICSAAPNGKRLAVDHNHTTGAVRALLCGPCNTALGVLEAHLEEVVQYVRTP